MNHFATITDHHGNAINPIELYPVEEDNHEYLESNFDNFQYVFTKDNMPTYHQQYNTFMHWIWNEYHNDPERYESDAYKEKLLMKIFTFINARVYGIVNPDTNHSNIIHLLQNYIDTVMSGVDIMSHVVEHARSLYGRKTPFQEEDAMIWYHIMNDISVGEYEYKPVIIPYIRVDGQSISLYEIMSKFYTEIFSYAIRYYDHVYYSKNATAWYPIDPNTWLIGKPSIKSSTDSFESLDSIEYLDKDDLNHFIMSEEFLHQAKDFCSESDIVYPVLLVSTNGRFFDRKMIPITYAFLIRTDDGMFISSQRGYDSFKTMKKYKFSENLIITSRRWIDTLIPKSRNEEAIRAEMWRDVMQCNVVLFPEQTDKSIELDLMILNWSKYKDVFCINMRMSDRITHIDTEHNIGYVTLRSIRTLYDIWSSLEHTLDLWVKYGTEGMAWSLISNIYRHQLSFYEEKPHITYRFCGMFDNINSEEKFIAICPRNGISWSYDGESYMFSPVPINGIVLRKCYL